MLWDTGRCCTSHAPKCTKTHHFFDFFVLSLATPLRCITTTAFTALAINASPVGSELVEGGARRFARPTLYRIPYNMQTKKWGIYFLILEFFSGFIASDVNSGRSESKPNATRGAVDPA